MVGFSWTQLGAWVNVIGNWPDWNIDQFAQIGGKWVVPQFQNSNTAQGNLEKLDWLTAHCKDRIRIGMWVNCFGEDPAALADETRRIHDAIKAQYGFGPAPIILDAEAAYQLNDKMSRLIEQYRRVFPLGTKAIGVTTNSLNDSVVYNGRYDGLDPSKWRSFRDLNIHVIPQWYNSPAYGWPGNPWVRPDLNMKWLVDQGMIDNLRDEGYADKRALRLNQVHGVLEVSGLESSFLPEELQYVKLAKDKFGYSSGISLYLNENIQGGPGSLAPDYASVSQYRGILYKG